MENLLLKPTLLSLMGIADEHLQFLHNTVNLYPLQTVKSSHGVTFCQNDCSTQSVTF